MKYDVESFAVTGVEIKSACCVAKKLKFNFAAAAAAPPSRSFSAGVRKIVWETGYA